MGTTLGSREVCEFFNPFKDLPDDATTLQAFREVGYISTKLRYTLLPTSISGDDYALCSKLLRSLETRRDLTPLVLEDTSIKSVIQAISLRGSPRKPIPEEPFDIMQRTKNLKAHWSKLEKESRVKQWEPRFATDCLPPLIEDDSALDLTAEEADEAETVYKKWRNDRDKIVSYLKLNAPRPAGHVQATKAEIDLDSTWEMMPWVILPGTNLPNDGSRRWLPIYVSLFLQNVPIGWTNPDLASETPKTQEEMQEETRLLLEKMDEDRRRREQQKEYQEKLWAERRER
ncbi:hypothetical protein FBEOM_10676 [Fusarium beomiforme]|uniref:Uncharacterized protein n=1 Tax=Fusarium beomiforme TaxID=44412 RepID=A0A9P5AAZ4_9HYPO|nr:hypothetical protein FBEOM_10676 [Fusarium beomiforme]